MGYSQDQRNTNRIASAYGYATAVMENTVPVGEFVAGQGVIVITKKGEPIMTGPVAEVRLPEFEGGTAQLKLGDRWYGEDAYSFRRV